MPNLFAEIATLLSFSTVLGIIANKLRQPLILVFILAGIILGPSALGWISAANEIDLLAEIGITLLLFIVGLKLDITLINTLGFAAVATGLWQVALTACAGYLLAIMLGISHTSAFYVSIAMTFSSTIIIVKLLTDKEEIDSLYGQIAIGILIVQDIIVVIAIIVLSALGNSDSTLTNYTAGIVSLLFKGIILLTFVFLSVRYLMPKLLDEIAKSRELLILFAIAWAITFAAVSDAMGFSKEVGGLLAGISLASTRYRDSIASRLESLRNFLLIFFFLDLGAKLQINMLSGQILIALVLSLFVLFAKPVIVMGIMSFMGYRKRTGFLTGLTSAQISEFSLILAALGESLGHISAEIVSLITVVGLITITVSTYMILNSHEMYAWLHPWLGIFERRRPHREDANQIREQEDIDVVIYGLGRHGSHIAHILNNDGYKVLGIDFDPLKTKHAHGSRFPIRYGDAEDIEFIRRLPLHRIKCIFSSIPSYEANLGLISSLRESKYNGKIVVNAYHDRDADLIRPLNIDLIITPYKDATIIAVEKIETLLKQE